MPNSKKERKQFNIIQQFIIILFSGLLAWDIAFNKNLFNINHLILSIFLIISAFDKFKLDNLKIKIPGLIEIAESNKEINKNIEKIVNIHLNNKLEQNIKQETKAQATNIQAEVVNFNVDPNSPIKVGYENNKSSGKINLIK